MELMNGNVASIIEEGGVAPNALNWCYAICAAGCTVSAGTCAGVCFIDGPAPFADAAGVKISAVPGGAGAGGAGMLGDAAVN